MGGVWQRSGVDDGLISLAVHTGTVRLRIGIALWLASWLPIPLLLGVTGDLRYVIWGIQVIVGIVGLAIAGTQFAATIKSVGWRATPGAAWSAFVHGTDAPAPSPAVIASDGSRSPET
jgi:hypothetical protein